MGLRRPIAQAVPPRKAQGLTHDQRRFLHGWGLDLPQSARVVRQEGAAGVRLYLWDNVAQAVVPAVSFGASQAHLLALACASWEAHETICQEIACSAPAAPLRVDVVHGGALYRGAGLLGRVVTQPALVLDLARQRKAGQTVALYTVLWELPAALPEMAQHIDVPARDLRLVRLH